MKLPDEIKKLKERVESILSSIYSTIDNGTKAEKNFLFSASRKDAERSLPPYYLVYILFVDLLGYKEKIKDW